MRIRMLGRLGSGAAFLTLIFLSAPTAVGAQQTQATINGTVTDESGGILPGVTVVVVNTETGFSRTLVSDAAGRYSAPQVPLGRYRVRGELAGFRPIVRSGIELTVGQVAVVDLVLSLGDLTEEIEVTADAPAVNTSQSALAGLVETRQIQELPINSRDYMQLAKNQQGVIWYRSSSPSQSTGLGARISVGGARDSQNSFMMDGTDVGDVSNSTPGGATGATLGVETIREFQILTNAYSAEFGRNAGGVINVVTRSGTNQLQGTVYHFLRNSALDAKNYFDPEEEDIAPFRRNQFGVMVAGPIRRDSTFFMGNFEGLRERLGLRLLTRVPTAEARLGILPSGTVVVADRVKPYLDLYPLPNGQLFGDGTGEYFTTPTRPTDQNLLVGRVDHRLGEADLIFARYTLDDSLRVAPDGHELIERSLDVRNQYLTVEHQHVFSSNVLNTLRFGFSRSANQDFPELMRDVDPALAFVPGHFIGAIGVTGMSGLGPGGVGDRAFTYDVFDFQNHVNWTRGRHALKFGGGYKRFHDTQNANFQLRGSYSFLSLANFLRGQSNNIEVQIPSEICLQVSGVPCDALRRQRQSLVGVYVQDDFKARPNLTFNLGLRYEFITVPEELDGKEANLRNVLDPETTIGPPFRNPSLKNFGPRLGMVWDPFSDGKTAVRLGFGVFYDQVLGAAMLLPAVRQPPFYLQAGIPNPPFPNVMDVLATASFPLRLNQIDYDIDTPRRTQYNVSLQRELVSQWVFNIGYVGSRSDHQMVLIDEANTAFGEYLPDGRKFFAPGLPRRNPNFANIGRRHTNGNAWYDALQAGINKRFSGGTSLQLSYTYSSNLSEGDLVVAGTNDNNSATVVDPDRDERGLSQFHVRHNAVLNYGIELPFGPDRRWGSDWQGVTAALLGGWDLNGIVSLAAGHPFTVVLGFDRARQHVRTGGGGQRPDLAPGCDKNPILGGTDKYFDPECFLLPAAGFYGNLGSQTLIGPGLFTVDFGLTKRFSLGGRRQLQVRAEMFNLLNRANFEIPSARTIFLTGGVRAAAAGRITSTSTTGRQIQLGLKFLF